MLQSKYHLINSINKKNKERGFQEMDFRFQFILEEIFKYNRQLSNDYMNWCYTTDDTFEINRESLNSFINDYKSKKIDTIKEYFSELSLKADRKRVDSRKKFEDKELTPFDIILTEIQYLAGYRGSKGYIKKEFVELLKITFETNPQLITDYKTYCAESQIKPEISNFIFFKNIKH